MARFCTNCGKEIPNGIAFCTECGAKAPEATKQAESVISGSTAPVQSVPVQTPSPAQTYAPPVQTADTKDGKIVSTRYYFGMMFVYSIPLIGFLICLISAFAGSNDNKKHFARAILIWVLIGIVVSVIVGVVMALMGGAFMDYINGLSGGELGNMGIF